MGEQAVSLGHATISLVEARPGCERDYNRWFERDHQYACLSAPWTLAGRRWAATGGLKALRYPRGHSIVSPLSSGSFLSAFWIRAGFLRHNERWRRDNLEEFRGAGRTFDHKETLIAGDHDYLGGAFRDADGVPAEQALDHGYAGLVCIWVARTPKVPLQSAAADLLERRLPALLESSPVPMALVFTARAKPDWFPAAAPEPAGLGERLLIFAFSEVRPQDCWTTHFASAGSRLDASETVRTLLVAPFVPTIPGTDAYVDQLCGG
jgi:hypothetical protein